MKVNIFKTIILPFLAAMFAVSCDDFLDKQPPSYVVPEDYYRTEDQVQACANKFYQDVIPTFADGRTDVGTDNQVAYDADSKYAKGQWKVSLNNDKWKWDNIRNINYQLRSILSRYDAGEIAGSDKNIRQYIGEIYFFRAFCYFDMLQKWGDLPIVTDAFGTNEEILVAANKRHPRNEVARFIISDLDSATVFMSENFESRRTRISPDVATLFKSRVALYEGSWLTNFKNTPFVPNGTGWPGATKDYNANYQFPNGSIDEEIKNFLEIAVASSEAIAEKYKGELASNTGKVPQSLTDPVNPYFSLFGNIDMTPYKEVLLWKEYNLSLGITNGVEVGINQGNYGIGLTRGYIENFLMEDGKPTYASHTGYVYDDTTLDAVRANRDPRLFIFLKEPGQRNVFINMDAAEGDHMVEIEPYPNILNNAKEKGYCTGYALRKYGTFDRALCGNGKGYTAAITFRATEALLNYIEAEYMLKKNIGSGKILEYWKTIREKAGFKGEAIDPNVTIAATDISKEALNDWGAYTGGEILSDAVLYNIRRERRCELLSEGLRWMDLQRWRSFDQLIENPYQIEGFHLWNTPIEGWYSNLIYDGSSNANVSSPDLSEYYRPYQKNMTGSNLFKNGLTWAMAQYLEPLPIKQFLLTSSDYQSLDKSPLYQNPYWPLVVDEPAEK